ncbi:MAG: TetR/AcrR family transcriptional regulator; helix-turn-helix transcriptional regulator [Actinobacteria bacterium]|nr:TetR/AcrR family transcriptional regulator; helix-turn-helix transcriptional regulator [Actinomycetota bacterium]
MRGSVLRAARECFARSGVDRTTMAEVAKAAGISRQTLYNTIAGRDELIEAVVVLRIEEIADQLDEAAGQPTVVEAVVETSVAAVDWARNDPELANLVATATSLRLFEIIAGPYPAVHEAVARVFRPLFDRARRHDELRGDVSDDELVEWIRTVYLSLILRSDLDAGAIRHAVRTFLLPSMTYRPAARPQALYAQRRM